MTQFERSSDLRHIDAGFLVRLLKEGGGEARNDYLRFLEEIRVARDGKNRGVARLTGSFAQRSDVCPYSSRCRTI